MTIIYFSALNFSTLKVPCVTMNCKFDCVNKNYVNNFAFFIKKIGFIHCYPTIQTFGYPHRAVFLKLLVIDKTRKTTKQIFIYHKNTFKKLIRWNWFLQWTYLLKELTQKNSNMPSKLGYSYRSAKFVS